MNETSRNQSELVALLESWVAEGRVPGAAACIRRGDEAVTAVAGFAALTPERRELHVGTPFDLASLTKVLATAPLLVQAERRGEFGEAGLGSTLNQLWPELATGSAYADVTLAELASHRSGLPAWAPLSQLGAKPCCGAIAKKILQLEPQERGAVCYSDLGFVVLGALLERRTATPLRELFRRRIAQPVGSAVDFGGSAARDAAATELSNQFERGMAAREGFDLPTRIILPGEVHDGNAAFLGGAAPHAGLFGTLEQVVALTDAIRLARLPDTDLDDVTRMFSEQTGSGRALGWELAKNNSATRDILPDGWVGHLGFTGTSVWLDPTGPSLGVLLTNRIHPELGESDFQEQRRAFHRLAMR